ncbi:response regulator [Anaerobacillus sp. MEB173]|uniref:response regulator n=1 Tax=Anaerobacillus sp. MEB173 TaxID=3383345 RepID=UPI003F8E7E39
MKEKTLPIEVMIIEDDELAAGIYSEFISKLKSFKVTYISNNGEQAINILHRYKPQLILLDIYLPDINGVDLLWKIRNLYRDIDIILVTASNEVETVKEAIRGGAFSYIIKPVMMNKFLGTLTKYEETTRTLNKSEVFKQADVDSLFLSSENTTTQINKNEVNLPKGIDKLTLIRIKEKLLTLNNSINANDFADIVGVSHSTARRYLEYLASLGIVEISINHGAVGRPERKYSYKKGT